MTKYQHAVSWIACNDEPGEWDLEPLSQLISVVLIADVFGKDAKHVAQDILTYKRQHPDFFQR